jgi:hypothetical protein
MMIKARGGFALVNGFDAKVTPRRQEMEEFSRKGAKTQRRIGMITPRRQARQGRPGVRCTCHLRSEEEDLGELGALA